MDSPLADRTGTDRPAWIPALVAAVLAAAVSATTLGGGFVVDDRSYVVENLSVLGERGIFTEPTPPTVQGPAGEVVDGRWLGLYRPVTVATWWITHRIAGLDPFAFHLGNVLLHAVATALVVLLAHRWSGRIGVSAWAGVLFAVHPIHVEAVGWIVGRAEVLSACLAIAAVLVHREAPGSTASRRGLRRAAAIALYTAAALAKETALPLPLLLMLCDRIDGHPWRRVVARAAPFAAAAGALVAARVAVLGRFGPDVTGDPFLGSLDLAERARLGLAVIGVAARKLALPFDLALHYPPREFTGAAAAWIGAAVVVGAVALAVRAARRDDRTTLRGLALAAVAMLPFVHLVPIGAVFGDRFLYLASAGLAIVAARAIAALTGRARRVAAPAAVVIVAVFAGVSVARGPVLAEERTIWEEVLDRSPACGLAAFEIARLLDENGLLEYQSERRQGAIRWYQRSLELEPDHIFAARAHLRLGDYAATRLGDASEALTHYRAALRLDPRSVLARLRLAMLIQSGLVTRPEALTLLDEALRISRDEAERALARDLREQIEAM